MIARVWRSTSTKENAEKYKEYLNRFVVPHYRTAEGNLGLYIMMECRDGLVHFMLITLWTSNEVLAKHVGVSGDVVHPAPDEKELLVAYESIARRYDILKIMV